MLRNQQTIKFIWLWSWMEQKEESSQSTKQQSNQSTFFNWGWLMELFGGLEWIVEFPLLWLGGRRPSIEFHSMNGRNGLWPLAPNKQSKGNESMSGRKRKRAQWNSWSNKPINKWNQFKELMKWLMALPVAEWMNKRGPKEPTAPRQANPPSTKQTLNLFVLWVAGAESTFFFSSCSILPSFLYWMRQLGQHSIKRKKISLIY